LSINSPYEIGVVLEDENELDELISKLLEKTSLEEEILIIVELDTRFLLEELSV
jgi:hypothetical protein